MGRIRITGLPSLLFIRPAVRKLPPIGLVPKLLACQVSSQFSHTAQRSRGGANFEERMQKKLAEALSEAEFTEKGVPVVRMVPYVYDENCADWISVSKTDETRTGLGNDEMVKIISWNLKGWPNVGTEARATAVMSYLCGRFGSSPGHLAILLQEVTPVVIKTLKDYAWVQKNFIISHIAPPKTAVDTRRYCNLMVLSKTLVVENIFRVPFDDKTFCRDVIVADLAVAPRGETTNPQQKDLLRLCTTHLSPRSRQPDTALHRFHQMEKVAQIMRGKIHRPNRNGRKQKVIGAIVGGDMACETLREHEFHKRPEVNLKDVWDDVPRPPVPKLDIGRIDTTHGRYRGWTHFHPPYRAYGRLDKFLYTGSIETAPLVEEAEDVVGNFGRLGIGMKTEADVWEKRAKREFKKHRWSDIAAEAISSYVDDDIVAKAISKGKEHGCTRLRASIRVSDHFGITVGVRLARTDRPVEGKENTQEHGDDTAQDDVD